MATETPKRSPGKRPPPDAIPRSSELTRYLPYVLALAAAGGLAFAVSRGAWYSAHAAAVLGGTIIAGLAFAGWYHVHNLPPGDRLRTGVTAVTLVVAAAALGPFFLSVYPPAPQARVRLTEAAPRAEVTLHGTASTVVVETSGEFKPGLGPSASGNYRLVVTHEGREEELEGTFSRTAQEQPQGRNAMGNAPTGDPEQRPIGATATIENRANRHALATLRGAGRYTLALDALTDTIAPPLRVDVGVDPFSPLILGVVFALLALAILAVDTLLARRGMESAYAAAMLLPLVAVWYLHGHVTRTTLPKDLLAAAIVGALAGGLGGEVLARVVRAVAPKG